MSAEFDAADKPADLTPTRWGPFDSVPFTVILVASTIANVGVAIFDTSSSWLMTSLNADPMAVSTVQIATTLPMFLLTLPAGALADILDSRRLLLGVEIVILLVSAAFAALVSVGGASPATLLATTFALGAAGALSAPAWLKITPLLVPTRDLDAAVAANGAAYNLSRASGRRSAASPSARSASNRRSGPSAPAIWRSSRRCCGGARRARARKACRRSG